MKKLRTMKKRDACEIKIPAKFSEKIKEVCGDDESVSQFVIGSAFSSLTAWLEVRDEINRCDDEQIVRLGRKCGLSGIIDPLKYN